MKKIIVASYAQIESKYHCDGSKNVETLFHAARRDVAVLFIRYCPAGSQTSPKVRNNQLYAQPVSHLHGKT
jgi:hypothetical protein